MVGGGLAGLATAVFLIR
ncbi:hypothetical protein EG860_16140, partial [Enterococcus faecalis]